MHILIQITLEYLKFCKLYILIFIYLIAVSSLPQGWHGISGPSKPVSGSGGVSGSSVPVTIRKKWNSPLSSNVPQTRLPSYKSSNLRAQNNLNNTHRIKSNVTTSLTSQSIYNYFFYYYKE